MLKYGSLFTGIGGFDLAAEWVGWQIIFQVEIDKKAQQVLQKNFPNVQRYADIKQFNGKPYNGAIDVLTGGFPCQPFSVAGKRKGTEDDRALWHEMFRVITEVNPPWVIAENVSGLLTIQNGMVFERVCADLESANYTVQTYIIPACATGAPHRRDRVWIVAQNPNNSAYGITQTRRHNGQYRNTCTTNEIRITPNTTTQGLQNTGLSAQQQLSTQNRTGLHNRSELSNSQHAPNTNTKRLQRQYEATQGNGQPETRTRLRNRNDWSQPWLEVATALCRMDDGLPGRVDRLKQLGNAIVPQVAFEIFQAINYAELFTNQHNKNGRI